VKEMVEEEENHEVDGDKEKKEEKKDSYRKTAIIVGLLFISATVSYSIGIILLDPILSSSDCLTEAYENEYSMIIGAFFVLIAGVSAAGIGIMIFPILKKYNESLALGYAGARIAEGLLFTVNVLFILTLLSLSQEFMKAGAPDNSYYQTFGIILVAAGDWAFILGFGVAFTISALILNFVLYQSKIVPRWISVWGFLGALLLWVYYLLQSLDNAFVGLIQVPLAIQEMVFAVWLIVKGFNIPVIDSKEG
jgi:hypothetical protein